VRIGLVAVPVKCYTAAESADEIHFHQIHRGCGNRITQRKCCAVHGDVPGDEIVSGYCCGKDQYVTFEADEIEPPESNKTASVLRFLPATSFSPIYLSGRLNYLLPDGPVGQKPYGLLVRAMSGRNLSALARIVVSGKDQLVLLTVIDGVLAMSGVQYHAAVRPAVAFRHEVADVAASEEEIALMDRLVDSSGVSDPFDWSAYSDAHQTRLRGIIDAKLADADALVVSVAPATATVPALRLMDALRASVPAAPKPKRQRKAAMVSLVGSLADSGVKGGAA
jgi:DNA end-binding protein Ku